MEGKTRHLDIRPKSENTVAPKVTKVQEEKEKKNLESFFSF